MRIVGEQSSGTFVSVPGETEKLKKRFGQKLNIVHYIIL